MKNSSKILLLLSGFDPTGSAGIVRDIFTAKNLHQPYFSVPTALAFQDDQHFFFNQTFPQKYFSQILKLLKNQKIAAIKIGMLGNDLTVENVVRILQMLKSQNPAVKIVWDPVFESTSGGKLLDKKGLRRALQTLMPLCDLITPNAVEFDVIKKMGFFENAIENLSEDQKTFQIPVYLKGGHLRSRSVDYLFVEGKKITLRAKRLDKSRRGTGCVFSTAVACGLAEGRSVLSACKMAKRIVTKYIAEFT